MQIIVAEEIGTRFFSLIIVRVNCCMSWKVEGIKIMIIQIYIRRYKDYDYTDYTNFTATEISIWNFLKLINFFFRKIFSF